MFDIASEAHLCCCQSRPTNSRLSLTQTSCSTSGLWENLLEKYNSKPEIPKRLMPRKCLGTLQSGRDLMGLTEKTQIPKVWKCYVDKLRAPWWLAHQIHQTCLLFSRHGKRSAWPQCFSQHSSKRDMRSVPETQVKYLMWNPNTFLMKFFTNIISNRNRLQEWNPDTAEVNGKSPIDFHGARTLPVRHVQIDFH